MTTNLVLELQPTCKMTQNLETPAAGVVSGGSSCRVKQQHAPEADWMVTSGYTYKHNHIHISVC